jgi:hypothetical protein
MAKKKPENKKKRGPYVAAAFFCEAAIEDKADGALSAIRIIDTINVLLTADPGLPSEEQKLPVAAKAVLSFKTGDSPGEHAIRVVVTSPTGTRSPSFEQIITFTEPQNGGANLVLKMTIAVVKGGIFWFNVYLDGKLVTCMPLHIVIHRTGTAPTKP